MAGQRADLGGFYRWDCKKSDGAVSNSNRKTLEISRLWAKQRHLPSLDGGSQQLDLPAQAQATRRRPGETCPRWELEKKLLTRYCVRCYHSIAHSTVHKTVETARNRKVGAEMTMVERYGVNCPCVVDNEILKALNLPKDCEDHICEWDYFLYYDDDDRIVWAYLGDDEWIYDTIEDARTEILKGWELFLENGGEV